MTLSAAQQKKVAADFARAASAVWQPLPNISQPDLLAAVGDADTWKDGSKASYNNALPAAFRNNATAAQKTLLLVAVTAADYLLDDPQAVEMLRLLVGSLQAIVGVS